MNAFEILSPNDETLFEMMEFIMSYDTTVAYDLILKNIENNTKYHMYPFYIAIQKSRSPIFVKPLLKQLEIVTQPNTYYGIVYALLSYKDDAINNKVIQSVKIRIASSNESNRKNLQELFKQYSITL
jgi:hypothetical protein